MADAGIRVRVAVCLVEDGQVLLVQHEKRGARYWLLPGGGVERGETLLEAAARELAEETGYAAEVGRLFLICEAIEPGGRHILNLFFSGRRTGGTLVLGHDSALRDAAWCSRDELLSRQVFPPVADEIAASWDEAFVGPVRVLGNVWRPALPADA
ncbi:MAG: NUDIX hydrolase [Candidatus Dormibacteraeota bacterium]|nr:NUDIX hydrolase [Candidatus Dormibacteraeota bacterium]MBV9524962.1 NUDIX hydrolase [Candidatus Dormibacteraeota bacterium]